MWSGLLPLIANRSVNASTMVAETHSPHPWLSGLKLAIFCGVLDAVANSLMLLGLRLGELTIMSVLTAMYSAGTGSFHSQTVPGPGAEKEDNSAGLLTMEEILPARMWKLLLSCSHQTPCHGRSPFNRL